MVNLDSYLMNLELDVTVEDFATLTRLVDVHSFQFLSSFLHDAKWNIWSRVVATFPSCRILPKPSTRPDSLCGIWADWSLEKNLWTRVVEVLCADNHSWCNIMLHPFE